MFESRLHAYFYLFKETTVVFVITKVCEKGDNTPRLRPVGVRTWCDQEVMSCLGSYLECAELVCYIYTCFWC